MQPDQRSQVRQILELLSERCRAELNTSLKSAVVARAEDGALQSGGTIRSVVKAIEEVLSRAVSSAFDQIAPVTKQPDALAMVHEFLQSQFGHVDRLLEGFAALLRGRALPVGEVDDILNGVRKYFEPVQERLRRQIEVRGSDFSASHGPAVPQPITRRNSGGRPRADHWDDMWATIANLLYSGDLKPKTQADIENAMKDWLVANEVEAGDTAVRDRARRLWNKIESEE